jgi:hypothetical protein
MSPISSEPRTATFSKAGFTVVTRLLPYLVPILLVIPGIIWISLDRSPWGGDQSQYGVATLDLFHTLVHSPQDWPRRMLDVFPYKPNGLIWLGQAFVPVAYLISSLDTSLLLAVSVLQVITLVLVYQSLQALSASTFLVPATSCLVIASAPLFVLFGHYYLVETYQVMSVAWFILIMSLAPKWNRPILFLQLTAATAFALSAKETQPLFCVWPGLVASFYLLRPRARPDGAGLLRRKTWISLALAIPLVLVTGAWYLRNAASVTQHLYDGTYGPGVRTLWGKEDTYLNTVFFWIQTARTVTFLPGVGELGLLLFLSAIIAYLRGAKTPAVHFSICAAASALQIVTAVLIFSLSPTRQSRYLLPILPYIAVLVGWSLTQLNHRVTTALTVGVFAVQLILVHGQALNAIPPVGLWVGPVNWNARGGRTLNAIVARTCVKSDSGAVWNVLAVEPSIPQLAGDWLAPEPANYLVAKQRWQYGGDLPCQYGYLGDNFFGVEDVSRAWESILSRKAQYVIVVDPAPYPTPAVVFNKALSRENGPILLQKLESSAVFELQPHLPEDPGILIFHRVDLITKGRTLSDRGHHEEAVALLRQAATLEPTNAEAWANLAFAYERAGRFQEAIAAGTRAIQLTPNHYYVDMILARVSFQENKWTEGVRHARDAESHAPAARERADALYLAVSGGFRSGDVEGGCNLLRQSGLKPGAEVFGNLPTDICEKR